MHNDEQSSDDAEKRRLANLKPFTAGTSGNPRGKLPGTRNRSTIAKEWLEVLGKTEDGKELPYADLITLAAIKKAMSGDVAAYTALNDNAYGKLTDKSQVELTATVSEIKRSIVDPKHDNVDNSNT